MHIAIIFQTQLKLKKLKQSKNTKKKCHEYLIGLYVKLIKDIVKITLQNMDHKCYHKSLNTIKIIVYNIKKWGQEVKTTCL